MDARLWALAATLLLVGVGCGRDDEEAQAGELVLQEEADIATAEAVDRRSQVEGFLDVLERDADLADLPPGTTYSSSTYPDGRPLAEGYLNDGQPIGPWRYWHRNGRLHMAGEYRYGGIEHGRWMTWTPEGQLTSEGEYEHGLEIGEWAYWYATGRPSMRGTFHLGERHGEWTSWHPSGAMASRGEYIRGHQAGLWRLWTRDGSPMKPVFYHDVPPPLEVVAERRSR